jgi:hypothetical protein
VVDADRLSPRLGRLIDEAKAAARRVGPEVARAEGVALLTVTGLVYVGCADGDTGSRFLAAAQMALAAAQEAGGEEILAAAVAVPSDPAGTVPPGAESCGLLARVDPDLQIVFKHKGRWVMLPLSEITPAE